LQSSARRAQIHGIGAVDSRLAPGPLTDKLPGMFPGVISPHMFEASVAHCPALRRIGKQLIEAPCQCVNVIRIYEVPADAVLD
jgi:hypothetical protein